MWRWIRKPLANSAGNNAAVGCVWHTQVMCSGTSLFRAASTETVVSKPFRCRLGLPTSSTDLTPALGCTPCSQTDSDR